MHLQKNGIKLREIAATDYVSGIEKCFVLCRNYINRC